MDSTIAVSINGELWYDNAFVSLKYPLDYHNYILNLTDVNTSNKPVWKEEYSPKVMNQTQLSELVCE